MGRLGEMSGAQPPRSSCPRRRQDRRLREEWTRQDGDRHRDLRLFM